jgi:hypothetical protein
VCDCAVGNPYGFSVMGLATVADRDGRIYNRSDDLLLRVGLFQRGELGSLVGREGTVVNPQAGELPSHKDGCHHGP